MGADGNPNPMSPHDVLRSADYEKVSTKYVPCWPGSSEEVVVRHKPTGMLWRTSYWIGEDYSKYESKNDQWHRVVAVERVVTDYVPAPTSSGDPAP